VSHGARAYVHLAFLDGLEYRSRQSMTPEQTRARANAISGTGLVAFQILDTGICQPCEIINYERRPFLQLSWRKPFQLELHPVHKIGERLNVVGIECLSPVVDD
jgi:hypothetical protein